VSYSDERDKLPSLDYLLGNGFTPGFESSVLDAGQALDQGIHFADHDGHLEDIERELRILLDRSPDEATARANLLPWISQSILPDGTSYLDFLRVTQARVTQGFRDLSSIPNPGEEGDGLRPPRVSRFTDEATANEASTVVVRAHETQLRAWTEDPGGWWRQHYYVPNVGKVTGVVLTRRGDASTEVTGAVVVMKRDHETGQSFIDTAYPEIAMPTAVRGELPDLAHLMGGYFGQDCFDEGGPLRTQHNFQAGTTDPARSRVREQLEVLLDRDDDALRRDVESLGSYVLPVTLRSWLLRMRWRMDAYDWPTPQGQEG